jgi:hypothetical protein
MATKFVTNLELLQNQIINGRFEVVESDPTTGNFEGRLIYNSTEKVLKWYDGTVWRKTLKQVSSSTTALVSTEANGTVTLSIADVVNGGASGLMTGSDKTKLDNATSSNTASTLALRDVNGRLQVTTPENDLDAANKYYVDAARSGLDVKQSVRLTTNEALPSYTHASGVLTAVSSGALSIDDITPAAGNRILVKNETGPNAPFNGIYDVTNPGSASSTFVLTRSIDADSNAEVTAGLFVFVEDGVSWSDSGWVLTTNNPINVGSTGLTFVQFSAAGQSIAGGGLTKTGNTIDVVGTTDRITINPNSIDIASTYVGQTSINTLGTISTGTWEATDVAVLHGGTGASTAADARTNLGFTTSGYNVSTPVLSRVSAKTIGDAVNTTYTITHNYGTRDVVVQVYDISTNDTVFADVVRATTDTVTITFSTAPALNSYRVVING